MAQKRKSISKKTRFEVFKRDNFTCQYCGKKAPDVILEVDHLKPVKNGGGNEIINLVTSCFDCNRGKGAREISDNSTVSIQREQLERRSEKIEQMKMMVDWKEHLKEEDEIMVESVVCVFEDYASEEFPLNDFGRKKIKKCIKSFGYDITYDGMGIAMEQYYKGSRESAENSMNKFTGICNNLYLKENDPDKYFKGRIGHALRLNRHYVNYNLVDEFVKANAVTEEDLSKIYTIAKDCGSSEQFWNRMEKEMT